MKKCLLVIISLSLLSPVSIGHSAEGEKIDGYDWNKWDRSMKTGFVIGWIWSSVVMIEEIPWEVSWTTKDERNFITPEEKLRKNQDIVKGFSKAKGLELYGVSIGSVIDMISEVYSDSRVKTWEIQKIMPLVRGRVKEGWTKNELEEVIAYLIRAKKRLEKWEEYILMSESERVKFDKELREPEVWKALRAYRRDEWGLP